MHPNRRRKKRPNYGLRTVEILRGPNGFGFTISGQQPCILSCIVNNSPADQAGLRAGDFLISVNGISVSKMAHDAVVGLIGNCVGPITMTIAENYYSDSSDEDLDCGRMVSRKPKYMHKPRQYRRFHKGVIVEPKGVVKFRDNVANTADDSGSMQLPNVVLIEDEAGPMEYKALIGYLGTIEMPKQLLPNARLQTVCTCIRKLRQEKRAPTTILMTILPTCLTLKNASNHIIAIYPTNRVVYVGSSTDKGSRYFGLVTSAVCDSKSNNVHNSDDIDISNSCHVFVVDSKLVDHRIHMDKAESFKINCTPDVVTGSCLEFPQDALYIVNLIQTMYKLQNDALLNNDPVMANSPQPSASSNSDSGIGYRDDCGNISDRILVVEFPSYRPLPSMCSNNRPHGIDGGDLPLSSLDFHKLNNKAAYVSCNDVSKLNNIRAYESMKNNFDQASSLLQKHNNHEDRASNKLAAQAPMKYCAHDSGQGYTECPVDVPEGDFQEFRASIDEMSNHSSKGSLMNMFRVPFEVKKMKKHPKNDQSIYNKLSPKVYGVPKANYSCEELSNSELYEDKFCYGSLQDLSGWIEAGRPRKHIAQSEPDVRIHRNPCDQNGGGGVAGGGKPGGEGPSLWATSFERLLEDPVGLHAFAEFLKKEFSAENIYFWTACERYRRLTVQKERSSEAQRIFKQHLENGAVEAVNVDAQGVQAAEQGLETAGPDIFDIAQKQIFNLIKFDSYPRFLKSPLYKQCLNGDVFTPTFDARLSLSNNSQQGLGTPKLKKSLSNAEDRRRKSLLPWHRKNTANQRSKSRDRNETQKSWDGVLTVPGREEGRRLVSTSDIHSSHSSLTSLDLAASQDGVKPEAGPEGRTALCRVLLTNGSTTVVQIREGDTIQQLINRLLEKRGLTYSSYEVFTNKHPKALDITEPSIKLAGCEVTIEQRVVFKLDLPNRKIISVKSKYTKLIIDVLRPILHKYKFSLEDVIVTKAGYPVDISLSVTTIDNARLNIQLKDEGNCTVAAKPVIKVNSVEVDKLEEITNKVFEGILQEKSEGETLKSTKSDKGSVKSEDWGSDHSSGLLGKFLRRDSGVHDKKKKIAAQRPKLPCESRGEETGLENTHKKPLIAKLKAGANRLHVAACSESDELVEGLTRAQRRLEDQRGTEINFELPDFLKDKDDDRQCSRPIQSVSETQTKVAFTKSLRQTGSPNYENQHITVSPTKRSPNKVPSVMLENKGPKMDPPPLPPKPKIVPIKPPNWGHPGFYKAKDVSLEKHKEMFLEQPSSSFV